MANISKALSTKTMSKAMGFITQCQVNKSEEFGTKTNYNVKFDLQLLYQTVL